jgi:hypothetical protein
VFRVKVIALCAIVVGMLVVASPASAQLPQCTLIEGPVFSSCTSTNPAANLTYTNSADTTGCTAVIFINWGDGSPIENETVTGGPPGAYFLAVHIYQLPGTYNITETGAVTGGGCTWTNATFSFTLAPPGFDEPSGFRGPRELDIYAPVQKSVRVCGTNQNLQNLCSTWNLPGHSTRYRLLRRLWMGTVTIYDYGGRNGHGLLDISSCTIPAGRGNGFAKCNGLSSSSLYDARGASTFYRFPIPKLGLQYGLVTIAYFISARGVPLVAGLNVGYGDNRGFTTDGFPTPGGARVEFLLDYVSGQGVMRIVQSCGEFPFGCGGPNPIVPQSPLPWGKATATATNYILAQDRPASHPGGASIEQLALGASDGAAAPAGAWLAGEIDSVVTLKSEPEGNFKVALATKKFPSVEIYQLLKGSVRTLVQFREAGWNPSDTIDMSPDLSPLGDFAQSAFVGFHDCTSGSFCS